MSGGLTDSPEQRFRVISFLLLWIAAATLIALRDLDVWVHPHFYAEDAVIFYSQQATAGWRAIFTPYNGYLHTIPRLAAALTWLFPAHLAAWLYALSGTLVGSLAATYFYLPSNRFIVRPDLLRAAACLIIAGNFDVRLMTSNLLNIQWFLLPPAILILARVVYGPCALKRSSTFLYGGSMVLIGLTVPILVVILPGIVWWAWRAAGPRRSILLALIAVEAVQLAVFFVARDKATPPPRHLLLAQVPGAACTSWCYRSVLTGLAGTRSAIACSTRSELAFPIGLACIWGAIPLLWKTSIGRFPSKLLLWGFGLSLFLTIAPLAIREMLVWYGPFGQLRAFADTPRYYLFAGWIFVYSVAVLAERIPALSRVPIPLRCGLLACLFALGIARNFSCPDGWREDWRDHAYLVDLWKAARKDHRPRTAVEIAAQPAPWQVYLPPSSAGR